MDEDDIERWSIVADNGTRPYHIATIENGQPGDCCATEGATAHLIAAAPHLLAALQSLLTASEWADETGYVDGVGFMDLDTIQANARLAITKAMGTEPPTTES